MSNTILPHVNSYAAKDSRRLVYGYWIADIALYSIVDNQFHCRIGCNSCDDRCVFVGFLVFRNQEINRHACKTYCLLIADSRSSSPITIAIIFIKGRST